MSKHPKQAFGIYEDGHTLRLVQLLRDKGQMVLVGMDRVELDDALYHQGDKLQSTPEFDQDKWEDSEPSTNEMKIDELDSPYTGGLQISPVDAMLSSFDLKGGVIALNINDDLIVKTSESLSTSIAVKRFAKNNLSPDEFRMGDWQSSLVSFANHRQRWFHRGPNLLLELIQDYRKKNRQQFYYQLADANDIALTDYFRIYQLQEQQRTMLIYLGQEYRKVFVFDDGRWQNTLPLQLSQHDPEPDVIYSKLSLALDSAQEKDPDRIVLCGELANLELAEYLHNQYASTIVEIISFSDIVMDSSKAELYDSSYLSQYTMAIALACKALSMEDSRWTTSNFLPSRVLEGQKVFKIAWHGFIVLFMIFAITMWATVSILKASQDLRQEKLSKRELEHTLEIRRKEAAEIQKIRNELENQEKNIEILRTILKQKNPWSEVLAIANRVMSRKHTSWLLNLKQEKEQLSFSGVTTIRANMIDIANAFPSSKIRRVTSNKIRDVNTWAFEITADLPEVDWAVMINEDLEELKQMKLSYGESLQQSASASDAQSVDPLGPLRPIAPQRTSNKKTDKRGRIVLPPLPQDSCPLPEDELTIGDAEDVQAYRSFVLTINKDNQWEYRDLGVKFITRYPNSKLLPAVRWWLCYRLYLDGDNNIINKHLQPMLKISDRYLPYALLLNARHSYAQGTNQYKDLYKQLKNDYGRHKLMKQVEADLAMIAEGGAK